MHPQAARRFGDIEPGLGQRFVDALPLKRFDGGGALGQTYIRVTFSFPERRFDVVRV